jgi:hypothetical protein
MIFRRRAVENLRFDELIPTYAGEDRDFSMQVGWQWRLLLCGDLRLHHHATPQGRDSDLQRNFQSAFGTGRRFVKYSRGSRDYVRLVATFLGDFAVDLMFLLSRPTRVNLLITLTRIRGFFAGLRSGAAAVPPSPLLPGIDSPKQQRNSVSSVL